MKTNSEKLIRKDERHRVFDEFLKTGDWLSITNAPEEIQKLSTYTWWIMTHKKFMKFKKHCLGYA